MLFSTFFRATTAGIVAQAVAVAAAGSLQNLTHVLTPAENPTGVGFYLYVPDGLAPPTTNTTTQRPPPILVNPHWCHGSALAVYEAASFAPALSDRHGFLVVYPDSPNLGDKCWDVSSPQSLSHSPPGGVGDSQGIVSMVRWVLREYHADRDRVFVAGVSSGAMMTNVLVGSYPDVFAAGSAFAAVAMGCFADGLWWNNASSSFSSSPSPSNDSTSPLVDHWNEACAAGNVRHTPAEWASFVRAAYPAYPVRGWRPKVQVFHGTADETLAYANLGEEIKQWTGVLRLLGEDEDEYHLLEVPAPTGVVLDDPLPNWTKMTYGGSGNNGWFEAYSAWNVMHNIPVLADVAVEFFDLACVGGEGGGSCFHWGHVDEKRTVV